MMSIVKKPSIFQKLQVFFKRKKGNQNSKNAKNKLIEWHSRNLSLKRENSCDDPDDPVPLATWPGQQLQKTVQDTVSHEAIDVNVECIYELGKKVESELQQLHPFEVKDQYDFCMICSDKDMIEAEILTRNLSKKFDLIGHLVWNSVYAGVDQFTAFEDVIERSSIVIFYITQNLLEDQFCCHIMRNRMVHSTEICGTVKDIPLLIDKDVALPESLILVQKLTLEYIDAQFPRIFTKGIRREKLERQAQYEMQMDNKRMSVLKDAIKRASINNF